MTLPDGYQVQDGCHNCRHAWTPRQKWPEHESCRYICLFSAQPGPVESAGGMLWRIESGSDHDVDPAGTCYEWLGMDVDGGAE